MSSILLSVAYAIEITTPHAEWLPRRIKLPRIQLERGVVLFAMATGREKMLITITAPTCVRLRRSQVHRWVDRTIEHLINLRED